MQQQNATPTDGDEQQEPDWALASYGQRVGAWALDFVGFTLPMILLIIAIVFVVLGLIFSSTLVEESITTSSGTIVTEETIVESWLLGSLFSSVGAVIILALLVVLIGYIVWWLFALRRGQTPGKQIVGIRVIRDDGHTVKLGLHIPARVRHQVPAGGLTVGCYAWNCKVGGLPVAPVGQGGENADAPR